jgi:hypothetical protein
LNSEMNNWVGTDWSEEEGRRWMGLIEKKAVKGFKIF